MFRRSPKKYWGGPVEWIPPGVCVGSKTIPEGPIQQVNIRYQVLGTGPDKHYVDLVVPDPRLPGRHWMRGFHIYSSKARTFPLVGRTVKCFWKGNDLGSGILNQLSNDKSVDSFRMRNGDVRIHATEGAWIIEIPAVIDEYGRLDEPQFGRLTSPGPQLACYQAIARHLLDTPIAPRP